jgi:S-formylglutathione hydrolase FrmB
MKKFKLISVFLLVANLMFAQFNLIDTSFYSPSLNTVKMVDVLLPSDYYTNPDEHYPVVYFLHGATENQNSYGIILSWTQNLIQDSIINPIILVKPDGSCAPYLGSFYVNSLLYGNYEDYIVNDLTSWIDSTFRTIPERQFRCITGHSMGGMGSAYLALKHPDIYRGFASHSGSLNVDTMMSVWIPLILEENGGSPPYTYTYGIDTLTSLMFTQAGAYSPNMNNPPSYVNFPLDPEGFLINSVFMDFKQNDASHLVKQITQSDDLGIFFSCGSNDQLYLYCTNIAFRDTLDLLGLEYEFLTTNGNHNLSYEMMVSGLQFLDSLMYFGDESCLPEGITFTTQVEIDSFQINYPGCTEIEGDVTINGDDISDLNGLNVVTAIGGDLNISSNDILYDLTGLEGLTYIGGNLEITGNAVLSELMGLDNVEEGSITDLSIYYNLILSACNVLGVCEYLASPNGVIEIHDNAPGCNNIEEVEIACFPFVRELSSENKFTISPNPLKSSTLIQYTLHQNSPVTIKIIDLTGQEIVTLVDDLQQQGEQQVIFNTSGLPSGIYFCVLKTSEGIQTKKIIKLD